ncbi:right-handed parallel beta-helix repeat-containing protein [Aquimarina sp. W85]|uniref:right-handed parallel beta-helix repeat-containing protein n=1 Tax=Aquimarina rhodophyticola TaxID=3342246 RepID=UPI00366F3E45
MKNLPYYLLTYAFIFISCSNENDDEIEILQDEADIEIPIEENELYYQTTPCDFDGSLIKSNTTVVVDCILDLKGKVVKLPKNVTFTFEGGDIINGTLEFQGGSIDGELLSSKISILGDVALSKTTFKFLPSRWQIEQGTISLEQAQKNKEVLESTLLLVKKLKATTLSINKMDAFFAVGDYNPTQNFYPSKEAINIPENFTFSMSDQTHLRVFPNNTKKNSLLAVRDASNVTIKGGNLHGDRDYHDYSSGGTHEWGHLIELHAATNTNIIGVTMKNATGDGMKIHDINFTFQPDHKPSHDILVTDCIFDSNRRNNLSITSGFNIIIENNQFLNAGVDTDKSTGIAPKFGIDIEAHRERNDHGDIVYYERAHDIIIRDNVEKNSVAGGFIVYIGENVTIENNLVETSISWSYTTGTKILNNRVIANPTRNRNTGIVGGRSSNVLTTFNNTISGNYIEGFQTGITLFRRGNEVSKNVIKNCAQGIFLKLVDDSQIYDNEITSTKNSSKGIFAHQTSLSNLTINDNEVNVTGDPFKFVQINTSNEEDAFTFKITNNIFNSSSKATISDTKGLILANNTLNIGTSIYNSSSIAIKDNSISSGVLPGIYLREVNLDISLLRNTINTTNPDCIKIESTTSVNEISRSNNDCTT